MAPFETELPKFVTDPRYHGASSFSFLSALTVGFGSLIASPPLFPPGRLRSRQGPEGTKGSV